MDLENLYYVFDSENSEKSELMLSDGLRVTRFKPSLQNFKEHKSSILIYLLWFIFTQGKYEIFYVKNEHGEIVHYSHVIPRIFKFAFMQTGNGDIQVGPCWTSEKYRGQKIYPYVLRHIINIYKDKCNVYIMTTRRNVASQKGILRAGFKLIGSGPKTKILGIYKLTKSVN